MTKMRSYVVTVASLSNSVVEPHGMLLTQLSSLLTMPLSLTVPYSCRHVCLLKLFK